MVATRCLLRVQSRAPCRSYSSSSSDGGAMRPRGPCDMVLLDSNTARHGALERERDAGTVAAQALPGVVPVVGDLLTKQPAVELREGERIGTVEHDRVEAADRDAACGGGGHAMQPMGPAPDAWDVVVVVDLVSEP